MAFTLTNRVPTAKFATEPSDDRRCKANTAPYRMGRWDGVRFMDRRNGDRRLRIALELQGATKCCPAAGLEALDISVRALIVWKQVWPGPEITNWFRNASTAISVNGTSATPFGVL